MEGLSLRNAKRGISNSFIIGIAEKRSSLSGGRRVFEITARTAKASKNIEAEVDKPLGLTLGQKPGGGVVIAVSFYTVLQYPQPPLLRNFYYLFIYLLRIRKRDRDFD